MNDEIKQARKVSIEFQLYAYAVICTLQGKLFASGCHVAFLPWHMLLLIG